VRLVLHAGEVSAHRDLLKSIFARAYKESSE